MSELELYKFIENEKLEIEWRGDQLVLWVDFSSLREFAAMIKSSFDGGYDVNLQEDCVALDLVPICEHYGIEPEAIQSKGRH